MSPRPQPRVRGFTLLEALVTLVIVSLIVTVLMQAMSQALGVRTRVLLMQRDTRLDAVQGAWFRESVQGMVADVKTGLGAPRGTSEEIAFATFSALGSSGLGQAIWRIESVPGGFALRYQDAVSGPFDVLPGPLRQAAFDFQGQDGEWQRTWDPPAHDLSAQPVEGLVEPVVALPRMVRFRAEGTRGRIEWIASVAASPWQLSGIRPSGGLDAE